MFELKIEKEKCKGCGLCVSVCVRNLLKLSPEKNSSGLPYMYITDDNECIGCKSCAIICPDSVISIYKK